MSGFAGRVANAPGRDFASSPERRPGAKQATRAGLPARSDRVAPDLGDASPGAPLLLRSANQTGLPDRLKAGLESLSGIALDDVRVHRNSPHPAQLQALAFANGVEIHLAPGQERHLPHEAWHVVQQKQGRVAATRQMKCGVAINDEAGLEHEADVMGQRADGAASIVGSPRSDLRVVPSSEVALIQAVRRKLAPPQPPITLDMLRGALAECDEQIADLGRDPGEIHESLVSPDRLIALRDDYAAAIDALRAGMDGDAAFSRDEIMNRQTPEAGDVRDALAILKQLRDELNSPLNADPAPARDADPQSSASTRASTASLKTRRPGLGTKWGKYNKTLKCNGATTFQQLVPDSAATVQNALQTQNILDAVHHRGKAFWISDPKRYKLAASAGKTRMLYTFNPEAARSLMEDFLLCGSGDFGGDNDEPWVGEAAHPDYTIWKPNELGAYGIGAKRLADLAGGVIKIQAFDAKGREIEAREAPPKGKEEDDDGPPEPELTVEPGVDAHIVDSIATYLREQNYRSGPLLVVSGRAWSCYIRCVLHHFNRIGDYARVIAMLNRAEHNISSGVEVGSPEELAIARIISEVIDQPFYVRATDVGHGGAAETNNKREGVRVDLVRTGVHFSLSRR